MQQYNSSSSYNKMFSSLTDRFFHGMNKRHTKMINTGQIKACLDTSRSRRNSNSKSKTTRIFDNSIMGSKRSSLNSTMQANTQNDFFRSSHEKFVPPRPANQNELQSRRKRKYLNKTSSQFSPLLATQQLHTLLEKHINKQQNPKNVDQQNEGDKVDSLGSAISIKDKLRKKIESNAIKRYSNVHYLSGTTRSERVDEKNIKQLLQILNQENKKKPGQPSIQPSHEVSSDEEPIINKPQQIKRPQPSKATTLKAQTKEPIAPKLASQISQQKQQAKKQTGDKKEKQRIHPAQVQKTLAEPVKKAQQPKKSLNQQKSQEVKKQDSSIRRSNTFWKADLDDNFITQIETKKQDPPKIPETSSKKAVEEKRQTLKSIPQTKQIQNKNESVQVQTAKPPEPKIKKQEPETVKAIPKNERKSGKHDKIVIEDVNIDQIEEIHHMKQTKIPAKAQNQKPQLNNKPQKVPPKKEEQIPKQFHKQQSSDEYQYDQKEVIDQIQTIFYLINELGCYCRSEKQFIKGITNQQLEKLSKIVCYYIWQQFFFLKSQSIKTLTTKKEDFYDVPGSILRQPQFKQFLQEEVDKQRKQIAKVKKQIEKSYQVVEPYLQPSQKPLKIDPNVNYLVPCQKFLQKQFIEIQKLYRKAIKTNDRSQQKLLKRLCQIIQTFCQLKSLNKEQTKEYLQIEDIANHASHYQNYKHLIVL